MPPPLDLTGKKFGRLRVVGLAPREDWPCEAGGYRRRAWLCVCACGGAPLLPIVTAHLGCRRCRHAASSDDCPCTGNSRSCGCLQRERARRLGTQATQHVTPRHCTGCGVPFLGTHKQKYHSRACKEAAYRRNWKDRHCVFCGLLLPEQVRRGRLDYYCSPRCKRAAATQRAAVVNIAATQAELQRRLHESQTCSSHGGTDRPPRTDCAGAGANG